MDKNTNPPQEEIVEQSDAGNVVRASWQFSLDQIQQTMAPYEPRTRQALIGAFLWCTDPLHAMDKKDFAQRVKISDNTIYKIYTSKYRYPDGTAKAGQIIHLADKHVKAIEDFISLEKKRFMMGETQLVQTPTLQQIVTLCDLVRESQTIGFLVGPSHIGKTWGLERFYAPNNNHGRTIYTRMEAASGLGGMVKAMARSLSISDKGNTTETIRRIKNAVTPDMLWLIDEVHLLAHTYRKGSFHNCMEVLREIHDVKKLGIVLCFTILDDVTAAKQKELQQLWRRAVHKVNLPNMPTVGDLTAILEHNGLEFPAKELKVQVRFKDAAGKLQSIQESPRELLRQIAKTEALLAVTERLRYARKLAKKANAKIDWSHFVDAHLRIAKQAQPPEEWN